MVYTKKTTRSLGKGSRVRNTTTLNKNGKTTLTVSRSTGSKTTRMTSSTNMNSGGRTKQYITTNAGGWRKTVLLNPVSKVKKYKKVATKKSKPMKSSTIVWIFVILFFISLISN